MWGCKGHWFTLPPMIRTRIWSAYRVGQEIKGTPSEAYVAAARAAQEWIREHLATKALIAAAQQRVNDRQPMLF